MFRATVLFFVLLLIPISSSAYTIVLTDGSVLTAQTPYTVEDGRAIFTTPKGRLVSLPMSQIDETATQKANQTPQRETYTSMTESHITRTAPRQTIDNYALQRYRKVAISQDTSPPFAVRVGSTEDAEGLTVTRADIQTRETQIQALRTQINEKVVKANVTDDIEAKKAMVSEINQLKSQYSTFREEYAQMIQTYNEQLFAARAAAQEAEAGGSEEPPEGDSDSPAGREQESDNLERE